MPTNDPTLYRGSAPFYLRGRLPYAPGMIDAFTRALELDGRGRLIDVGCGPGVVALELASTFEEVVGIDADEDMIAEADTEAGRRGIANARWITLRAELLPAGLGSFRVATLAQSFHWMDRKRVAGVLRTMLEPAGALVHVNAYTRRGIEATSPTQYPEPPWDSISGVIRHYLGSETRAGQGLRDAVLSDEDDTFRERFTGPSIESVPDGRVLTRTADQVMASVYSVSSSAPHLFGDRLDAFDTDVRAVLRAASSEGLFSQQTGHTQLRIWRPRMTR